MVDLRPFRAWRFQHEQSSATATDGQSPATLGDLVSPPYDKIPDDLHHALLRRHAHNVVRIIKPVLPGETRLGQEPYDEAARLWHSWRGQGVLVQDEVPGFTLYTQHGTLPGGGTFRRVSVQAAVRLSPYGPTTIRRHEQTLSKPLTDRLFLMRATKANTGVIFGLFHDPTGAGWDLLEQASKLPVWGSSKDFEGVTHEVRRITDPTMIQGLRELLAASYVIIADGHHRYETALRYQQECHEAGLGEGGHDWVLMSLVGMQHPGLHILATHRALRRSSVDEATLAERLAPFFDQETVADFPTLQHRLATEQEGQVLGWYAPSGACRVLTLRPDAWSHHSGASAWNAVERGLDVVALHRIIIEHALGFTEEEVRVEQVLSYLRSAEEGRALVDDGSHHGLFLLRPTTMTQVADMTEGNQVMPQKSTDFFPKMWSGFTFRDLTDPVEP